ncbi:MAG TPA: hypothetical protein VLH08_11860 [Acidobacteriota bacterium]|nr:hypothetical protein [Acidobacteriota bacterium]
MLKHLFIVMLAFVPVISESLETVIVPQFELPLKKSYIFSEPTRDELILFYEKLTKPSSTLFIERRRPSDRSIIAKYSFKLQPGQTTRLADYLQGNSVLLVLIQHNKLQTLSSLAINVLNRSTIRSSIFTIEEARRVDRSIRRLSVTGMTWDNRAKKESFLINGSLEEGSVPFLASVDISGRRIGSPVLINRRVEHKDLAVNSCSSTTAAITEGSVRILNGNRSRTLITPEEISFDPEQCRYGVIRRPFNEIPQFYFLDASLNTQHFFQLPGAVAPGLVEESRNQLVYSSERNSFFYPTADDHALIALSEITGNGVKFDSIPTSVDSSSISITTIDNQVFLLISGLRVRTFERVHQLILISVPPPGGATSSRQF